MNLCRDCKWKIPSPGYPPETVALWKCISPNNQKVSPLDGMPDRIFQYCYNARWDNQACGAQGTWWEYVNETPV